MYMKSRKLVLMNLFARKEQRCRSTGELGDTVGHGENGTKEKVASIYTHYHV